MPDSAVQAPACFALRRASKSFAPAHGAQVFALAGVDLSLA
jgi:hypothetical protein